MQGELKQVANLVLFARVVQTGGISKCALDLGMERTTVSRRLADLERDLGVRLLDRTPQNIAVTTAGKLCYEQCEQMLQAAKDAQSVATNGTAVIEAEPINVGAPPDIIEHYLGSKMTEFEAANPRVTVHCHPVSQTADVDRLDVDLTIGWEAPAKSVALVRKLTGIRQSVFASPGYLAKHGTPVSPEDIRQHSCIVDRTTRRNLVWRFERDIDNKSVSIKRRIEVTGMLEAKAATMAGLGLARLPDYLCQRSIKEGRLVVLLSEYTSTPRALLLVSPHQRLAKPRATMLRLFLEDAFGTDSF